MRNLNLFRYFKTSPEVIRLAVMMYVRFPLSLRNVEDLLHERGIDVSHETVRHWWNRFGPMFAAEIRRRRIDRLRAFSSWRWHVDELFVRINGERCYLWRAVYHEGEVLEAVVTKRRNKRAAVKLLRKLMKRCGRAKAIVTDRLPFWCGAESARSRGPSGDGALAQQSGRELAPAASTTRTSDAPVPAHAGSAEVRRRSFLRPQPLQPRTPPLQPGHFQAQPIRCSRRVASNLRRLKTNVLERTETVRFCLTAPHRDTFIRRQQQLGLLEEYVQTMHSEDWGQTAALLLSRIRERAGSAPPGKP